MVWKAAPCAGGWERGNAAVPVDPCLDQAKLDSPHLNSLQLLKIVAFPARRRVRVVAERASTDVFVT